MLAALGGFHMAGMRVELAFFEGEELICTGAIDCRETEDTLSLQGGSDVEFRITHKYELPACPVEIECQKQGEQSYKGALRIGVHTSEDWQSINLGNIHELGFRCEDWNRGARGRSHQR